MSGRTDIEWADATWNPVVGCTRVSEGCRNCYAEAMAHRFRTAPMSSTPNDPRAHPLNLLTDDHGRWNGTVRLLPDRLSEPLRWRKPRRIFVCSMSDLFHAKVPFDFVDHVLATAALCPQHTFMILTKRPELMAEYLTGCRRRNFHVHAAAAEMINGDWSRMPGDMAQTRSSGGTWWPLRNVWLGTSVEDQKRADERIPHLLRCPAAVRFLSVEPMLSLVDIAEAIAKLPGAFQGGCDRHGTPVDIHPMPGIDWVIVGGESGPKARPCAVDWIRGIVRQCKDASVPCFVKQLGARPLVDHDESNKIVAAGCSVRWDDLGGRVYATLRLRDRKGGDMAEWPEDLRVREWPEVRRG